MLTTAPTLLLILLSGCALMQKTHKLFVQETTSLRPIVATRDAIQLEVVFIQRPVQDPLLGHALWNEIDQIGALSPEARDALKRAGIRIGHIGSTPPRALQALLGLTSATQTKEKRENSSQLVDRRVTLRSGQETEIVTSFVYPACFLATNGRNSAELKEFRNARCVFRVKANREQDGWVNLEFLPEVHHGNFSVQPTPIAAGGWQYRTTQNIEPLFDQRFSVHLSVGEMVLITVDQTSGGSLGQHFFLGADSDARLQRLLVVRLADMRNIDPVYAID